MQHGILSYDRAAKLPHQSVAMQPVQDRRDQKSVPGGYRLHRYANLYLHARNPMLFKRLNEVRSLCIVQVSLSILKTQGAVLSDCNAASDYVRFHAPQDWRSLNFDDILSMDWRHPNDPRRYFQHKSRKCAEALIPDRVPASYVTGAYVVDAPAATNLQASGFGLPITVNPVIFFR